MKAEKPRVSLVTGAATGMGRALVERLARRGESVVAVDIKKDEFAWAADYPGVHAMTADLTRESDNEAMVRTAEERLGGLDAVVLNAALSLKGHVLEMPMADFDRMFAINVRGVALGLRAAIRALRRRGGGAIVVTASMNAIRGSPDMWAYDASKGAALRMAQSAAVAVAHEGIRINVVCPGPTRGTGMTGPTEREHPEVFAKMASRVPMRRWGEADEIGSVMEFLISPGSSFMTGAVVPVDGGILANLGTQDLPER